MLPLNFSDGQIKPKILKNFDRVPHNAKSKISVVLQFRLAAVGSNRRGKSNLHFIDMRSMVTSFIRANPMLKQSSPRFTEEMQSKLFFTWVVQPFTSLTVFTRG